MLGFTSMLQSYSTTSISLLAQNISDLEHYMDWVIAGSGIVITIIIALFVTIQFVALRRLQDKDIEEFKQAMLREHQEQVVFTEEKITQEINKIQISQENENRRFSEDLDRKILYMEADTARLFAISARQDGVHAKSFLWWMRAAKKTISIGQEEELVGIFLKNALSILSEKDIDSESIQNDLSEITKYLDEIMAVRRLEGRLIEQKLEEVIGLRTPMQSVPPIHATVGDQVEEK